MVEDVSKGAAGYGREGRRSRILHYLMAIYILGGLPGGEYAKFIKYPDFSMYLPLQLA